jgi:hypothetical protein
MILLARSTYKDIKLIIELKDELFEKFEKIKAEWSQHLKS